MPLINGSYYPDSATPASIATIGAAMAQAEDARFDASLGVKQYRWANSTARASATGMRVGDLGLQVDTVTTYRYSGSAWTVWDKPWTPYTPILTATTTNPNLGSSGSSTGAFAVIAGTVHWRATFVAGGSGIAAGNGEYSTAIPWPAAAASGVVLIGYGWIYGSGGFKPFIADGPSARMVRTDTGAVIDHTVGFSSASNALAISGSYQAA